MRDADRQTSPHPHRQPRPILQTLRTGHEVCGNDKEEIVMEILVAALAGMAVGALSTTTVFVIYLYRAMREE